MPTSRALQIGIAITESGLYLAIRGDATHRAAWAAQPLAGEFLALDRPQPRVILDLAASAHLDSTFAGWVVRLRRELAGRGGALVLANCPAPCRDALRQLGLESMLEFEAVAPIPAARTLSCCDPGDLEAEAVHFMLAAHRDLAATSAANERAFGPVVTGLHRLVERGL